MTTYFIYLFLNFMSHAMVTVRYPGTEVQRAIENMGLNPARYTQACYEIQMQSMVIINNMTTEERLCKAREEKIQKKQDYPYVKSQTAAQLESGSIHSRAGTSRWQKQGHGSLSLTQHTENYSTSLRIPERIKMGEKNKN